MNKTIKIGTTIRLQADNYDDDENSRPRIIPAGSIGTVTAILPQQEACYSVTFDTGGWLFFTEAEITPLICQN